MNQQNLSKLASITFGVLVLCFLIGFYTLALWQEPGVAPPGGNVDVPINVGSTPQKRLYSNSTNGGQLGISIPLAENLDSTYALTVGTVATCAPTFKGIKVACSSFFEKDVLIGTETNPANLIISTGGNITLASQSISSWSEVAGVSYWKLSGSNLYTSSTAWNVGIGITSPSTNLHVVGNARITGLVSCNTIDTDASGNLVCGTDETAVGGGAPVDASYVVIGLNGTLTNERRLLAGTGISISDGGVNGDVTIAGTLGTSIDSAEIADGTITYSDTNVDSVQRRVSGSCAAGNSIRIISNDGSVTCEADDVGLTSESDPQVGLVTNGQWCRGDGGAVQCDQSSPLTTASDYGRSGVSNDLYEGTTALTNKYVERWETWSSDLTVTGSIGSGGRSPSAGYGILAKGSTMGGYFEDAGGDGNTAYAYVGYLDSGIRGYGNGAGGFFWDTDNTASAYVAYGSWGLYTDYPVRGNYLYTANVANCSATTGKLYTDASGKILCGTDQTGGGGVGTLSCSTSNSSWQACNGTWYIACPSGTMTGGGMHYSWSSSYTTEDEEVFSRPYENGWYGEARDHDYFGNCRVYVRCCTIL